MSHYGQEQEKQAASLVDGISVKISEKYKPPRKIVLPVGYQNRVPIATADEVYDFSLENTVLQKITEWKKVQEDIAARRKENIRIRETKTKDTASEEDNRQAISTTTVPVSVTPCSADVTASQQQYSSILTPVPINTSLNTVTHHKTNIHHFNLSDFETDTSDPFDTVELKTINDMEELAHVLQPIVTAANTVSNYYTLPYNSSPHFNTVMESNKESIILPHLNGLTGYRMPREGGYTTLPFQQKTSGYVTYPSFWGGNYIEATTNQRSSQQDGAGYAAVSKSVPDIMKELDIELKDKRRGPTPPTVTSSRPASFGSTGLENWKPWPDLDSPEPTTIAERTNPEKCVCALPNPFSELSAEEQKLSRHISEMGFPLPRVARACQLVGSDDKKMVEFLIRVQVLEEKGYPGDRAERALTVNECDLKEAERCLQATAQLLDLGFPEDRVAEALAKSNNDRDLALEHLIS